MNNSTLMQGYGYDYNNPKNVGGDYKVKMDLQTYEIKGKILEKLDITFLEFGNPNKIEKEILEQINAENIELYHKIKNKIKFYKNTIGIILDGNELIFDKKQIGNFKTSYELTEIKAKENKKELLNEAEFIKILQIFENNIEILKELLNLNFNSFIWGEGGLIYNLSNDWNAGHIQYNIESNKKLFRLGTIYKNKKPIN